MSRVQMDEPSIRTIGRYQVYARLASGGMATVYLGRLIGPDGFARPVAIKELHPQFAREPEFARMFLDEAHLASRVHHQNVVDVIDVVEADGLSYLIMDFHVGETLARLHRSQRKRTSFVPLPIASALVASTLLGLHAAHEACGSDGRPLGIVHRDVSPQNILVGTDGVARVLDFGIAKARTSMQQTKDGQLKGKLAYMAPEQLQRAPVTPKTDVYATGVVLWELLAGEPLFTADDEIGVIEQIRIGDIDPPSTRQPAVPQALDDLVLRALSRRPDQRFDTARDMAVALEKAVRPAGTIEVEQWVNDLAAESLVAQRQMLRAMELTPLPLLAPARTTSPRRSPWWWTTVVGGALVPIAVVAALGGSSREATPANANAPASTPPMVENLPMPTAPADPPAPSPAPSMTAAPPAEAPRPRKPQRLKRGATVAPKPLCDPPFVRDENGIIRYKRECLSP